MKTRIMFCMAMTGMVALATCSCRSAYYGTMETFGIHKRDILVDRVESGKKAQELAAKQFKTALERFGDVVGYDGGALESKYKKLSKELERSEARAKEVRERVASIETVSKDLFKEWGKELKQYSDAGLRKASEQQLRETKVQAERLIRSMQASTAQMDPVLTVFRDQVLFLKHNLNSQAIAGIRDEAAKVEMRVESLIRDMEASIAEAEAFIKQMGR